jgi:F-type H+-transporting ATPase subunit a
MSKFTTKLRTLLSLLTLLVFAAASHAQEHGAEAGSPNPLKEHPGEFFTVMGFVIATVLILVMAGFAKRLSVKTPSRKQLLVEQAVASMQHFCKGAIGEGGEKFAPMVGTIFAFILCSNLCGVLPGYLSQHAPGATPASWTSAPTANLSMTLALGFIVFIVFNVVGIKANGIGKYLAHFAGPIPALAPLIFPIEMIGALVRPLSLAMRLFGNVFGEGTVIAVLIGMAASTFIIPLHAPMLAFGIFGSVVQAGVFAILTCSYIALAIGDHGHDHNASESGHRAVAAH